ncbi:MAG: hypothetical protein KGY81_03150, partial [Phycisphaerae bacterium]|nr:hypothetical protein [Phycisphaerae bacterium]
MQRCDRLYARRRRRRGAALLMAVVTLAVVTALAVSLVWTGNSELQASAGFRDISVARSAADSGLQYFLLLMEDCRSERLHVDETPDMFDVVYDHLTEALPDTPPSIEGE